MVESGQMIRRILLLGCAFLLLMQWGCGGVGGGGGTGFSADSERTAIEGVLKGFMSSAGRKDSGAAQSFLSEGFRAQQTGNALAQLQIVGFGADPLDPTDNATFTFTVPEGGIYIGSPEYAEVFAFLDAPTGNRINLTFRMIKLEGDWYISDFSVTTDYTGAIHITTCFPLHVGDYWKYRQIVNGSESPYLVVRTVESVSQPGGASPVFTIRETFEPLKSGSLPAPTGGMFSRYGGLHRFSNTGGIWDYGPPPDNGFYSVFGNAPIPLAPEWVGVGSTTFTQAVTETFLGRSTSAQGFARIAQPWDYKDRMGEFPAIGLVFSLEYAQGARSPFFPTSFVKRWWYLKDGLGIVAQFFDDGNTWTTLQEEWLVEARVAGKILRPTDWPFEILTAGLLSDGNVGEPFQKGLTARWGTPPLVWTIRSGQLPSGLVLDASGGSLSGTPLTAGTFRFTVGVEDQNGRSATKEFSQKIREDMAIISPSALPPGRVNEPLSIALQGINLPTGARWGVASFTSLPGWLSLGSDTGILTGVPGLPGRSLFQIYVEDPKTHHRAQKTFELVIRPLVSGTISISGCLAFGGNEDPLFIVKFQDQNGQPVNVASDSLVPDSFSLFDRLVQKAAGPSTTRTAHPSMLTIQDGAVHLRFASGTVDMRSTTLELVASGVFSEDFTRVCTAGAYEPDNLGRFRDFTPWSALRTDGGTAIPRRICLADDPTATVASEVFILYKDSLRCVPIDFRKEGARPSVSLATARVSDWTGSQPGSDFVDIRVPAGGKNAFILHGTTTSPSLLSVGRGGAAANSWSLNADTAWTPCSAPRFLGLLNLAGSKDPVFLVGDRTWLLSYVLRSADFTLTQTSSFAAQTRGVTVRGQEIFTLLENGQVRSFRYDSAQGLIGGQSVGTLPTGGIPYPSVPEPSNTFGWDKAGTNLTFDVADPVNHRLLQFNLQTNLVSGRERGGDPELTSIRGRLNRPFSFVRFDPEGLRQFTIVADADGLQIFEDRDAQY